MQQTLTCLSKLYRSVEHKVFAGLAQDAIAACTAAVQVRESPVIVQHMPHGSTVTACSGVRTTATY